MCHYEVPKRMFSDWDIYQLTSDIGKPKGAWRAKPPNRGAIKEKMETTNSMSW
jgi:hypothetical protein